MERQQNAELLNLSGKVAIVTGGAVGIGFGIANRLALAGASVVVADINEYAASQAVKLLRESGNIALAVQTDVSDQELVKSLVKKTISRFGKIDILVNNAGIYPNVLFSNMKITDFDKVINVNLRGLFMVTKAVTDQMIKQKRGGKIINISSIDAIHPSSIGLAHYDASKHGIWGFTKNIALELAQHNISVNAVAPGGINTPGVSNSTKEMVKNMPKELDMITVEKNFTARIPLKRMGEPDDIGKVVLFLASDMSSYITGAQIVVDGGYLLS